MSFHIFTMKSKKAKKSSSGISTTRVHKFKQVIIYFPRALYLLQHVKLFSWALKSQAPRKSLQPVQLCRLFSDATGRAAEEETSQETMDSDFSVTERSTKSGMERSINEVRLLGRVGRDPTIFEGKKRPYIQFPLATSSVNRSIETGERNEVTEWHTIVNYNPQKIESISRFLKKGDRVYVSGKLIYTLGSGSEKFPKIILNDFISMH